MPHIMDATTEPLLLLDQTFNELYVEKKTPIDQTISRLLVDWRQKIENHQDKISSLESVISQFSEGSGGTLVRFGGFVQDMFEPEYFMAVYTTQNKLKGNKQIHSGLFRNDALIQENHELLEDACNNPDSELTKLAQRQVFNIIPVPAETHWMRQSKYKDLNSISQLSSTGCLVKVYENGDAVRLNELYEFVGVLEYVDVAAPNADVHMHDSEDRTNVNAESDGSSNEKRARTNQRAERQAHKQPCIHVLSYTTLKHNQLPASMRGIDISDDDVMSCRDWLLNELSVRLCGDKVAAEFVLLHLISSISHRTGAALVIGKLALNIYGLKAKDEDVPKDLYELCETLLTKTDYIGLSIDELNRESLVPHKDYEQNKLVQARLQLSAGTQLVIDELCMKTGQLTDKGVRNVAALKDLVETQKLDYDFGFHKCEFPTNLNILIVSEGKSLIGADCYVKLFASCNQENASQQQIDHTNKENMLARCRHYLCLARAKHDSFHIGDDMKQQVEHDYVQMRQENKELTGHHLNQALLLARLLSLSLGSSELTLAAWQRAKVLIRLNAERNNK